VLDRGGSAAGARAVSAARREPTVFAERMRPAEFANVSATPSGGGAQPAGDRDRGRRHAVSGDGYQAEGANQRPGKEGAMNLRRAARQLQTFLGRRK
jgi:hypothetical protein